jgi:putative ABC transport system permease protein
VVTRHKVTFVMTLPKRYVEQTLQVPGVRKATFANWFGGRDPAHESEFFQTLAVDGKTFFDVYDEVIVPKDQLAKWNEDRQGAIIGDQLAKRLGWKLGQKVSLTSGIYPGDWDFIIDGIYETPGKTIDRSSLFFHWEYVNENVRDVRKDQVGWITSRVDDPARSAEIGKLIDKAFDEREIQTLSQDEHSFQTSFLGMMSAMLKAIDVISLAILLIMLLILGNTIAMGVRERTREYGVLRAIGFSPGHVIGFVLGEAFVVGLLGGGLGVLLAYPIVERGMGRWIEENMGTFFPWFRVTPQTAFVAILLAVILAGAAAAIPAYRAARISVVDALRRVG